MSLRTWKDSIIIVAHTTPLILSEIDYSSLYNPVFTVFGWQKILDISKQLSTN